MRGRIVSGVLASAVALGGAQSCAPKVAVAAGGSSGSGGGAVLVWVPVHGGGHVWRQVAAGSAAGVMAGAMAAEAVREEVKGTKGVVRARVTADVNPGNPCRQWHPLKLRNRPDNFIIARWIPAGGGRGDRLEMNCGNFPRDRRIRFADIINCVSNILAYGHPGRGVVRQWSWSSGYINAEGREIGTVVPATPPGTSTSSEPEIWKGCAAHMP